MDIEYNLIQSNNKLKRIFKTPTIEWCSLVKEATLHGTNPFFKGFIKSVNETSPELFVQCPIIGRFHFTNVTLSKSFLRIFPSGNYSFQMIFSDLVNKWNAVVKGRTHLTNWFLNTAKIALSCFKTVNSTLCKNFWFLHTFFFHDDINCHKIVQN